MLLDPAFELKFDLVRKDKELLFLFLELVSVIDMQLFFSIMLTLENPLKG